MNDLVYKESFTLLLLGIWILLQCYDMVSREENKIHFFCVIGKLLATVGFLVLHPFSFFALILFFCFYPKTERGSINYPLLVVQMLLSVSASVLCMLCNPLNNTGVAVLGVALMALLFALTELGIRSVLLKNEQLYRQMEYAALNEVKVKNLNREISVRAQVAERNARLEEREHIARNIHNVVGHTITSALVSLQAYEVLKEADPQRAEGKLAATSERMHLALDEIRRAVRVLDEETEEISLQDFCNLLATEADKFSMDTEIRILHNFAEILEKDILVEKRTCEFLHSVLTECLNNGIRHGQAKGFFVNLTYDTAHIRLVISDDGTGFAGISDIEQRKRLENGYGLRKMKEYVLGHGGTFRAEGENGFKVQVVLPMVTKEVKMED